MYTGLLVFIHFQFMHEGIPKPQGNNYTFK